MFSQKYNFYNNTFAWLAFAIALITYFLTVEPTVSLWDCGEFLSSSYKLEVGHPPGAPLFMLIGRFFSLFAPNKEAVALFINSVSVFASAFTILFLFWTITYFAKKIITKNTELTKAKAIIIFASGFIGALAYAFSDTFWFSAVEAEVYASSSFFTAIVFWAILKWETISEQKFSNKWLIFIALMIGLSIGVHLLNLLAIPAIVFVYYFKKYNVTNKGLIYSAIISILLIAIIMYGIILQYVVIASKFELLFVNTFGLPYNSGLLFYIFLSFTLLAYGIYYSYKKKKVIFNTILTSLLVILIGYSTYTIIVIRSFANPPMDENNPENIFSLLSYLNRDQYGSRPLLYGQYFDAKLKKENGEFVTHPLYTYIPKNGKYLKIEKTNPEYEDEDDRQTFFPRMYSRDQLHISAYKSWTNLNDNEKPSFFNNIQFFISYQFSHMYLRYFMWNFVGRQNNIQGNGGITNGNWLSGIAFIDSLMLGNQTTLPSKIKNDKSRNTYFFLPLILGIIGILYLYSKDKKSLLIIFLLFFFTGIAIVVYLNQTPYQPRERDYAYAGSFYAFAIWIGIGVAGVYNFLSSKLSQKIAIIITILLTIPIPTILAFENWDDHDRSGKYTARDFAKNYLASCEKNAILFTYGDNDTFPLWFVQEVEGFRTDIKVVNLSLLGTDWYIDQMKTKTYEANPIPFSMGHEKYREGKRDAVYIMNNPELFINEKYNANKIILEDDFNKLKKSLIAILNKSNYPNLNNKEFLTLKEHINNFTPIEFAGILNQLTKKEIVAKYKIKTNLVEELTDRTQTFLTEISNKNLPLNIAMDFVASDNEDTQLQASETDRINYLPSKKLSLSVNWQNVTKTGDFTFKELSKFEKNINWKINQSYLYKNDMAVLEILARNNWERPIYFATSVPHSNFLGLQNYFRLEGFAYRLVPYKTTNEIAYINTDVLYKNLMEKFSWGRINKDDVYIGNFDARNVRVMKIRETFSKLANKLIEENKKEKAIKVLDYVVELLPESKIKYDVSMAKIVDAYYKLNENKKAESILDVIIKNSKELNKYYNTIGSSFNNRIYSEKAELQYTTRKYLDVTEKYKQSKYSEKLNSIIMF